MKGRIKGALMAAGLAVGLAGCAHADTQATPAGSGSEPAIQPQSGFPDLRSVPREHLGNTDQNYWNAAAAEVLAAAEAMRANPRALYQPQTENPAAFLEEAQRALAETRDSH